MKKFLLYSLLVLAVIVCGFYAVIHQKASQTHAAALVGENTLLFIHCPDIRESRARWTNTALHQIANEPEVRDFLRKPKAQLPKASEVQSHLRDLVTADPREAFFALESISKQPAFVAGALCLGDKGTVDSALAELGEALQKQWPKGQKGTAVHSGVNIQTFTQGTGVLASAWVGRWILVADDLDLIKKTIDRAQRNSNHGLLQESANFQKSLGYLPSRPELIAFVQPQGILQGLSAFGKRSGSLENSLDDLKAIKVVSMALKFDGEYLRDAVFALTGQPSAPRQLTRQSLQLTTSDTLVYFAGLMDLDRAADKITKLSQNTPGLPIAMAALKTALANLGIPVESLPAMLGNEYGMAFDWPAAESQPSLLLSFDVKDAAMTTKTVDLFTSGQQGGAWTHTQSEGTDFFTLTQLPLASPTLAITDKKLIFSSSSEKLKDALANKAGGLQESPTFKNAEKLLKKPTQSFGYIDSRALFERIYSTSRPLLMMMGGVNPTLHNAIDVTKLPPTESISKHLQPIVYSCSSQPDGLLVESIGPVTFTQTVLGAGIGLGAALIPMAKPYLMAALLAQPKQFQGSGVPASPIAPGLPPAPQNSPVPPLTSGTSASSH